MKLDSEKIDRAVLALLYLVLHEGSRLEGLRLGRDEPVTRERLNLRSGRQGKIGRRYRGRSAGIRAPAPRTLRSNWCHSYIADTR
jgi:hypothetical protein